MLIPNTFGSQRYALVLLSFFCLAAVFVFAVGCGGPNANQQQAVNKEDPEGDFKWVIRRLDRILRPSRGGGLKVTQPKVEHEIFRPSGEKPYYTARVKVVTEVAFLHKQRQTKKKEIEEPEETKEPGALDPLVEGTDGLADFGKMDELGSLVEISGRGAPAPAAATVETRRMTSEAVFNLEYIEGRWRLTEQPEDEHQRDWFKYALQ